MKQTDLGQSLAEMIILIALIASGILGLWTIFNKRITEFIDLVLAIISRPVP